MNTIVKVGYPYVYDLYYRVQHAGLVNEVYQLDFYDWIRAGIAYNIKGSKDPKRRISYFVSLYTILQSGHISENSQEISTGVIRFYEDIYQLYQDHLRAQLALAAKGFAKTGRITFKDFKLIPTFTSLNSLSEYLTCRDIEVEEYKCENLRSFRKDLATEYVSESSTLFKYMSVFYDYGVCGKDGGVLLEVK